MQTKAFQILAATVGLSLLATAPDALALDLPAIQDVCYDIKFGNADIPELPAGFFGPGSEPFISPPPYLFLTPTDPALPPGCPPGGTGDPLTLFAPDPVAVGPSTIQIELVELNLRSIEPIVVTADPSNPGGADTQWDMFVTLTGIPPVPGGTGGFPPGQFTVDSFFDIEYRISFVNIDDGTAAPGGELIGTLELAAPPLPWFYDPVGDLLIPGFDGNLPLPLTFASPDGGLTISGLPFFPPPPLLTGDLNADGFVGIEDLNIVLANWNQPVPAGDWLAGDPTGDGFVGIEDLNYVLGNWNAGTPPANNNAVPEPATATLLAVASLTQLRRRARSLIYHC